MRDRRLARFEFRRQFPVGPYIADFVCPAARLVVEIDGDQHAERIAYDAARTRYLERCGYRVIRFTAREAMVEIDTVLEQLFAVLEERMSELRRR